MKGFKALGKPSDLQNATKPKLQNATKELRTCSHKEIFMKSFIMTDDNGLEFKICSRCWSKYKRLSGYSFRECPLSEVPTHNRILVRIVR